MRRRSIPRSARKNRAFSEPWEFLSYGPRDRDYTPPSGIRLYDAGRCTKDAYDRPVAALPVLLIATTNPGKLVEIREALRGLPLRLLTLADVQAIPEPEETGRTFGENARIKAEAYAAASGLPTVAEDSGLVIDTIGGRPGVESARYPGATYADKF